MSWANCYVQLSSCRHIINMWVQLFDCTIVEQCVVIWFLWSEGIRPSEIHWRMLGQYGEDCIMQRKVYQWVEGFQTDRTSIIDKGHLGHLTTSWTVDSVEWVNALVQEDRQITVTDTTDKLDIRHGFIYSFSIRTSGVTNLSRWMPKQPTGEHKWACLEMCMHL
jgi:hypothetical protein